jgi:hypothetical protein
MGAKQRPNQRMKLSWRGGRLKGKASVLIAAAGLDIMRVVVPRVVDSVKMRITGVPVI